MHILQLRVRGSATRSRRTVPERSCRGTALDSACRHALFRWRNTKRTPDPPAIDKLSSALPADWREATIEAAPGTLTSDRIRAWQHAGINRVSLGVQFFRPGRTRAHRPQTRRSYSHRPRRRAPNQRRGRRQHQYRSHCRTPRTDLRILANFAQRPRGSRCPARLGLHARGR